MKKHTPGPWTAYSSGYANTPFLIGPERDAENVQLLAAQPQRGTESVAEVFCDESPRHEEMIANSNLIAAAPELLEACQLALNYLETKGAFSDGSAYPALLRAIAKAEGRKK